METKFIKAPSAELRVTKNNGSLSVMVKGQAVSHGRLQKILKTTEVHVSIETLDRLVTLKGDWWLDELERRQDPGYIRNRLESLVARFGSLKNALVLDIGSGAGSSSFMLLDLGAEHVHGVEPDDKLVGVANMRAHDEGVTDRVTFTCIKDTSKLPFDDGRFDVVTFNAVIEHIPPANRKTIIKEAWRCLKTGGFMIFTETPNRAYFYDGHTTGLPFIPWLPLALAFPLAKALSRHVSRGLTKDSYIAQGLVGGSYWQIKKALPDAECMNAKGGDAAWKIRLRPRYKTLGPVFKAFEWIVNRFGLPFNAFTPILDLVFRKK